MNKIILLTMLAPALLAGKDGAQCEWAFIAPPAKVSQQLRASLPDTIVKACPGRHEIAIKFGLKAQFEPKAIQINAPTCAAARKPIKDWISQRSTSDYVTNAAKGSFNFTVVLNFAA